MKWIAGLLAVSALGSVAMGVPFLEWTADPEGPGYGLTCYTFYLNAGGTADASWAANLTFSGYGGAYINQIQGFGMENNREPEQILYWPWPDLKRLDSWVYKPFCEHPLPMGIHGPVGEPYRIHAGSGPMALGTVLFAQIVSNGWVQWEGVIARHGVDYPTSGLAPEPTALAVLAIGAMALRRKPRQPRKAASRL